MPFRRDLFLIASLALAIALTGNRPYAGGWNDGSRLATVESLVDRGTFAIDDSIFVQVSAARLPYPPDRADLHATGTLDKLLINGHYYSDKSPVPALLLAGAYGAAQRLTGLSARESPHEFCRLMNLLGGSFPYVIAVVAIHLLAQRLGLTRSQCWLLTLSFGCATIAPAYSRHVNNHVMLLAVAALMTPCLLSAEFPGERRAVRQTCKDLKTRWPYGSTLACLSLGTLAGFGYTIDLGLGPMLLAAVGGWVLLRGGCERSPRAIILFAIAALPWSATHHVINYQVTGMLGPAGANAEYLRWPGSPFDERNMTGRWQHAGPGAMLIYAADLLVGQRGFLGHNLPLYLALFGLPLVLRHRAQRSVVLASLTWCVLAFLTYAATSNNYSGLCLSIRWFLPMLAPCYLVLALVLRARPAFGRDLLLLSSINAVTAAAGWWYGPWQRPPLALYWATFAGGLFAWAALRVRWRHNALGQQVIGHSHLLPLQFPPRTANNTVCRTEATANRGVNHGAVEASQ